VSIDVADDSSSIDRLERLGDSIRGTITSWETRCGFVDHRTSSSRWTTRSIDERLLELNDSNHGITSRRLDLDNPWMVERHSITSRRFALAPTPCVAPCTTRTIADRTGCVPMRRDAPNRVDTHLENSGRSRALRLFRLVGNFKDTLIAGGSSSRSRCRGGRGSRVRMGGVRRHGASGKCGGIRRQGFRIRIPVDE
jgi:hypothetical protein